MTKYEIGYCNPPKKSRFNPGQSGNPNGRPKGSKNTDTIFLKALNSKITVKENGKTCKKSAREVIIKRAMQNALSGDLKSAIFLLNKLEKIENKKEEYNKFPPIYFYGEDKIKEE